MYLQNVPSPRQLQSRRAILPSSAERLLLPERCYLAEDFNSIDLPYLVSRHARTQYGPYGLGINVLRQHCQILRVQHTILLETAVLMVQVISSLGAMLLPIRSAEVAFMADAREEADTD